MKNLENLLKDVLSDFDALGIEYGKIIDIKVNTRAKSRWGQCQKKADGYHINISSELLADDLADFGAKDTIAHEVCHTIKGCMNHGATWKQYAQLLAVFGYNVKRTNSAADKGIDTAKHVAAKKYKYVITCGKCGCQSFYSKKTKAVDIIMNNHHHTYTCGKCHSHNLKVKEL